MVIIKKQLSYEDNFGNKEVKMDVPGQLSFIIIIIFYCSTSVSDARKKMLPNIHLLLLIVVCVSNTVAEQSQN